MDDKQIPYFVFEGTQARHERTVKRLIIALIIITSMMFASNALWLHAWTQYDYSGTEETITLDGHEGLLNFIGNDGLITNGTSNGNEENETKD